MTVSAPTGTEPGSIDHVTFSVNGRGIITSLSANLKVINGLESQVNFLSNRKYYSLIILEILNAISLV